MHNTERSATIAVSLLAALAGGWLAHRLRLSEITGYPLAGVAMGPTIPLGPRVSRLIGSIQQRVVPESDPASRDRHIRNPI